MTKRRGTVQYGQFDSSCILSILISPHHSRYLKCPVMPFLSHTIQGDQIHSKGHWRSTTPEPALTLSTVTTFQVIFVSQIDPVGPRSLCNHPHSNGSHPTGSPLKAWKPSNPSLAHRDGFLTCRQHGHLHGRFVA